jgi:hypothetical protein
VSAKPSRVRAALPRVAFLVLLTIAIAWWANGLNPAGLPLGEPPDRAPAQHEISGAELVVPLAP